jgi:anti-anti-sigma factor
VPLVSENTPAVQWTGRRALVRLPDHIDVTNASQISEQLLSAINRGATDLVADLTATISCDHAGADAIGRAYQRAAANGTQLRLVVPADIVRRILSINGLDRLIPIYPSAQAALAATRSGQGKAASSDQPPQEELQGRPRTEVITRAVLWELIGTLSDGVVLTDEDGELLLVSRRAEDMFGYEHGELTRRKVEVLLPDSLRPAHRSHRRGYLQAPRARPMGAGARLLGRRKDGTTFPAEISLSPVPTATGHLTFAVIRDAAATQPPHDLADLARATSTAQAHHSRELLDKITSNLFDLGLSLQTAINLPHHVAIQRITEALSHLDDTIHHIRDHVFATHQESPHPPPTPNGKH